MTATKSRYTYDPDRGGTVDPGVKASRRIDPEVKAARAEQREELRQMDSEMSGTPGYSTSHIDSQRHMPGSKAAELGHPRKERKLPAPGEVRQPSSSWQKRQRYSAARQSQSATPRTELATAEEVLGDSQRWLQLNDELSKKTGNAHELSAEDERDARRLDRMIQRYERRNDRGHVVYTNTLIPSDVPTARIYSGTFAEGEVVDFDRYTVGAHDIHETEDDIVGHDKMVTFEIATRRGRYFGGGARSGNTRHLLPRGLRLVVVGKDTVTYTRPDGTTGRRHVVQLADASD